MADTGSTLNIFISWSGEKSLAIAESLHKLLSGILERRQLWLSSHDISGGTRWSQQLSDVLEKSHFGILVATSESLNSSWLLFEAGALSKHPQSGRVIPYLVAVGANELPGPLAQFQALKADRDGTLRLVRTIAALQGDTPEDTILVMRFNAFWKDLEACIERVVKEEFTATNRANSALSTSQEDRDEIEALKKRMTEISRMLQQFVQSTNRTFISNEDTASFSNLKVLEGAWVNMEAGTHMYAKIINGELHVPYCYAGNDILTGVYYDWERLGEYWFARYQWFTSENIKGFAFYKFRTSDVIEGMWWPDDEEAHSFFVPEIPKEEGVKTRLVRIENYSLPDWAQRYFRQVEKNVAAKNLKKNSR